MLRHILFFMLLAALVRPHTALPQAPAAENGSGEKQRALKKPRPVRTLPPLRQRTRRCSDGRDNDRDGLIDQADAGCSLSRGRREQGDAAPAATPAAPVPTPVDPANGGISQSLKGRRPFPDDNAWNQDISQAPVDPNSDIYIASIGADIGLHPDFGTMWNGAPNGTPYVIVGGAQPRVPVHFTYAAESDPGPYPIPPDAPIQGGPHSAGDRHVMVIDWDNWMLYELWDAHYEAPGWRAGSGAVFNLSSNQLRPPGWTSADAAGLPMFPGLVRYDEVYEQGEIRHALRFTVEYTRRAYTHPARHFASWSSDPGLPPMGMRVRLKASVDIGGFPHSVQVILRALKTYGMLLADNGGPWFISGAPDARWSDDELATLRLIKGRDLEVVQMGWLTEG